jgi:hypothetical protein
MVISKDVSHIEYEYGVQIWSDDNDHCIYLPRKNVGAGYGPEVWTVLFAHGRTKTGPSNWEPA